MAKCYGIKNGEIVVYGSPRAARAYRFFGVTHRLDKLADVLTRLADLMEECEQKARKLYIHIDMGTDDPLTLSQEVYVRSYLLSRAALAGVQADYQVHFIDACGKSPGIVDASTVQQLLDLSKKWNDTASNKSRIQEWVSAGDKYHPLGEV